MPSPDTTAALHAAVVPLAAYVARTPAGNRHADQVAAAVDAVADYVEEAEREEHHRHGQPNWQALVYRLAAHIEPTAPPSALVVRCRALLDSPRLQARAARPLAQRMALAQLNSHYLGPPDTL